MHSTSTSKGPCASTCTTSPDQKISGLRRRKSKGTPILEQPSFGFVLRQVEVVMFKPGLLKLQKPLKLSSQPKAHSCARRPADLREGRAAQAVKGWILCLILLVLLGRPVQRLHLQHSEPAEQQHRTPNLVSQDAGIGRE